MAEKIVIALGGNALQSGKSEATAEAQLEVVKKTCEYIADISCKGYEIGLVHGNGPQVGRILLASETAKMLHRLCRLTYAALCHRDISDITCSRL